MSAFTEKMAMEGMGKNIALTEFLREVMCCWGKRAGGKGWGMGVKDVINYTQSSFMIEWRIPQLPERCQWQIGATQMQQWPLQWESLH